VTADIDFDTQETTEEKYDPNTIISEETTTVETAEGLPQFVGGMPGTPSNITPSAQTITTGQPSKYTKQDTTKSYMVSKTVSHKIANPKLKRLSVAVMVNDKIQAPQVDLERLVKSAVGYDTQRNDKVEVVRTSFFKPKPITPSKMPVWEKFAEILKYPIFIVIIIIIAFFVLMRTLLKTGGLRQLPLEGEETPALATSEGMEETPAALEDSQKKQRALEAEKARQKIRQDIIEVTENQPEVNENHIRYWLEQKGK